MAQLNLDIANRALIRLGLQQISAFSDSKQSAIVLNSHFQDWKKELLRSHPWNFAIDRNTLHTPDSLNPQLFTIAGVTAADPVVVDLLPASIAVADAAEFDHGFYNNDTVYIESSLQTELNDRYFSVGRGGARYITLYKKFRVASGAIPESIINEDGTGRSGTGAGGTAKSISKSEWSYSYDLPNDVLRVLGVDDLSSGREFVVESTGIHNQRAILCNIGSKITIKYLVDVDLELRDIDFNFAEVLSLKIAMKLSELLVKTTSVTSEIQEEYIRALSHAKSLDAQEGSPTPNFHSTWADEMGRAT